MIYIEKKKVNNKGIKELIHFTFVIKIVNHNVNVIKLSLVKSK